MGTSVVALGSRVSCLCHYPAVSSIFSGSTNLVLHSSLHACPRTLHYGEQFMKHQHLHRCESCLANSPSLDRSAASSSPNSRQMRTWVEPLRTQTSKSKDVGISPSNTNFRLIGRLDADIGNCIVLLMRTMHSVHTKRIINPLPYL